MTRILVVEDDRLLGQSIKSGLEDEGYQVDWAIESQQAFAFLQAHRPEMILLDIMLPGEDGYQILKKLKAANSDYLSIPVVMLTNLGQIGQMERAMELGAEDYVIKSNIDLEKLVDLVKEKLAVFRAHQT